MDIDYEIILKIKWCVDFYIMLYFLSSISNCVRNLNMLPESFISPRPLLQTKSFS